MTRQDLELFLPTAGWLKDTYGNFKKTIANRDYRIKMQANSCRIEIRSDRDWLRVGGDYYSKIKLVEDGKKVVIGGIIIKRLCV